MALGVGAGLLAGCGTKTPDTRAATDTKSACQAPGDRDFTPCTVERTESPGGTILTLRHPDGAFRRLLVAHNGHITAADGAQQPSVTPLAANRIEVELGGARYRLPAPAHLAQAVR